MRRGFLGRFPGNRSHKRRLPAPWGAPVETGVPRLCSAPAQAHCALVLRDPDEGQGDAPLPWQPVLAAAAQMLGFPSPHCQSLKRGGEEHAPGHLCDSSRCVLYRQEGIFRERREGWCRDIYGGRGGKGVIVWDSWEERWVEKRVRLYWSLILWLWGPQSLALARKPGRFALFRFVWGKLLGG